MKKYIVSLSLAAMGFTACQKDVQVKIKEDQPVLVVNSMTQIDEPVFLQIGKSVSILKHNNKVDMNVTNATVVLTAADNTKETLTYDASIGGYLSKNIAKAGNTYSVSVVAPGYKEVESQCAVPDRVLIDDVRRVSKARLNSEGRQQDEIRISFTDPATKGDFYVIKYYMARSLTDTLATYGMDVCMSSNDASIESISGEDIEPNSCLSSTGIFLRDELFNGKTKELKLYVDAEYAKADTAFDQPVYPVIELYHVSEAYYRFSKSYQYAYNNNGNPFSEPANVYSNIKNGYGIFSVTNVDEREVK